MQAKPGRFLSGLILIFGAAITFATLVLVFRPDIERMLGDFPNWFNPFLVIFLVARLTALTAIWNMKRWGVYAFFLLECLEVSLGLFVFTSSLTFPLRFVIAVPLFLVVLGIWYLALRNKWQAFA